MPVLNGVLDTSNMAKTMEVLVREALAERLNINFVKSRLHFGKWGRTDGESELGDGTRLILEVESSQKHPSTNVLKVWPYLEENKNLSVILVHAFFPDSESLHSSRGNLAVWLAGRLEEILRRRFTYRRIIVSRDGEPQEGFSELQDVVQKHAVHTHPNISQDVSRKIVPDR